MLSKEKMEELEKLSLPIALWIRKNFDPHTMVTIDTMRVDVVRGEAGIPLFKDGSLKKDWWGHKNEGK